MSLYDESDTNGSMPNTLLYSNPTLLLPNDYLKKSLAWKRSSLPYNAGPYFIGYQSSCHCTTPSLPSDWTPILSCEDNDSYNSKKKRAKPQKIHKWTDYERTLFIKAIRDLEGNNTKLILRKFVTI
jgi:hypothetical protein